jgi:polyphenol oxidase
VSEHWIVPDWPAPRQVHSLVTTRAGGESCGCYESFNLALHVGDDPQSVLGNRARLRAWLPAEPLWLRQVHSTTVIEAHAAQNEPEADAAVVRSSGVVLAVLTADCVPVLLCDREGETVAIVHAGWRGLAGGIVENAVRCMAVSPARLMAYLGPGIGPAAYEVGQDVYDAFVADDPRSGQAFAQRAQGKYSADLYALARQRLERTGTMAIYGGAYCTHTERGRFFSHRRDGRTGRMASLIWLQGR